MMVSVSGNEARTHKGPIKMSHNLYHDRAMMFVGDKPWHGLGIEFPANATYEQIAKAVGFYEVVERRVFAAGLTEALPDVKALVRADDGSYLSTVGIDYGVVQIAAMARAVLAAMAGVAQSVKGAVFHTAGLLGQNGIQFWLMGELGEPFTVKGYKSQVKRNVLAHSAHDGVTAAILKNIGTNVVCQNTVNAALSETGGLFAQKIRHTANAAQRVQDAAEGIGQLIDQGLAFEKLANAMATTRFDRAAFSETVDAVIPMPEDGKAHPKLENQRETIMGLFNSSKGGEGVKDNAWSAYQSWTEFADHYIAPEVRADRLQSIWFGRGDKVRTEALNAIVDTAGLRPLAKELQLS
jgi:phage/plasmid-like protein (TIGR03299 family)